MKTASFVFFTLLTVLITAPSHAASSYGERSESQRTGSKTAILISKARLKIGEQQYEDAITQLKEVVRHDSENADAYNLLGYSYRKMKIYQTAEEYYQKALNIEPKHKGALEYLGELYIETDRLEMANKMLQRLDDACLFRCKEYKMLQSRIEEHHRAIREAKRW